MSKFQQRHYEAVAEVLRDCQAKGDVSGQAYLDVVLSFSAMFSQDNPNYKRSKFLAACGVGETEAF